MAIDAGAKQNCISLYVTPRPRSMKRIDGDLRPWKGQALRSLSWAILKVLGVTRSCVRAVERSVQVSVFSVRGKFLARKEFKGAEAC